MNILDLIDDHVQYWTDEKNWLLDAIESEEPEEFTIITETTLNRFPVEAWKLQQKYYLTGLFSLAQGIPSNHARWILCVWNKEKTATVKTGMLKLNVPSKGIKYPNGEISIKHPDFFIDYCEDIEDWLDTDQIPEDQAEYEFNEISREDLAPDVFSPVRYRKRAMQLYKVINKEKLVTLKEVAEVHKPIQLLNCDTWVNYLPHGNWEYPINYSKLPTTIKTTVPLQKGDIIFRSTGDVYLIDKRLSREVHASINDFVIRPKKILPEYLYLFLKSDTGKEIFQIYANPFLFSINKIDLENAPVILPDKPAEEYKEIFHFLSQKVDDISELNKQFISIRNRIPSILDEFPYQKKQEATEIEDILEMELANNLRVYKQSIMQEFLTEDLKELNVCFKGGAYKATLILAGSILEAVLIDWLSELHGKDYFEQPYYVKNPVNNRTRSAKLVDYINEINEIERPNWIEEAEKAHEIRNKRNLVHAKLCMKSDDVNEETCRQVIEYLKDVLRTRGIQ